MDDLNILDLERAMDLDPAGTAAVIDRSGLDFSSFRVPGTTFLERVLFLDGVPVGYLAGEMVAPKLLQLFQIYSETDDTPVGVRAFIQHLHVSQSPEIPELFTSDRPRHDLTNRLLPENGYALDYVKNLMTRTLTDLEPVDLGDLEPVPLADCDMHDVMRVFRRSLEHHSIYGPRMTDFSSEYQELVEDVDQAVMDRYWTLYRLAGEFVGYAFPAPFRHDPDEGTVKFIALLPEHTGKGFGRRMHLHSLHLLARMGAKTYIGSTETDNAAMARVFEMNGCRIFARQMFYKKSL